MENSQINDIDIEFDVLELFMVLLRRWKMLLLGVVAGGLIAAGLVSIQAPVYKSQAKLFILSETTSITSLSDIQIGSELSADFTEIAMTKPVIDTAIASVEEEYGYELTRADVKEMVSVSVKNDTRILIFTATSEDPELACAIANAMSDATAQQIAETMKSDPPTTVEEAEVETTPIDNGMSKYVAVGAVIGLVIMALIFLVPYLMNDSIITKEDVEKYLEEGVLVVIPLDKGLETEKKSSGRKGRRREKN